MQKQKKIWFNNKFIDWDDANVHVLTHSLHYGSAVFEGLRAYRTEDKTAVFRLNEHLERFFASANVLNIKIPFSKTLLKEAILKLIKINNLKECYIRPIVFYGYGEMGIYPKDLPVNIAIAAWPWDAYLNKETVKAKISKYIRLHPRSCPMSFKISGYYVNSIFATLEAKEFGFDEAILLDYKGCVAEGPGENIFMVKKNKLFTPSLGSILPGITRDSIIKIAQDLKISVKEKNIKVEEIKSADEAFFAGTAIEICPISQIDNKKIKDGKIGPITLEIKEYFERIVRGREKKYLKWLTFV